MDYIGAHIGIKDGLLNASKIIRDNGGNCLQVFLATPNQRSLKYISQKDIDDFKKFNKDNDIKVVVHSSYILNIARNWDKYSWWVDYLIDEIEYAEKIGSFGIVLHFGKQLELSLPEAYNNMYSYLLHIGKRTINSSVKIILETTAGQGTELCYKIEELSHFYKKISSIPDKKIRNRFGICIDTCHIFAAGYDIRNKKSVKMYVEAFQELIGLKHVSLIHFNDSLEGLGSRKDRHQPIGHGMIGYNGLLHFAKVFKKLKVPIILETPNIQNLDRDITMLEKI